VFVVLGRLVYCMIVHKYAGTRERYQMCWRTRLLSAMIFYFMVVSMPNVSILPACLLEPYEATSCSIYIFREGSLL